MSTSTLPQFDIKPHDGVGPIKLGMNRSQVRAALINYDNCNLDQDSSETLDYAFGNSLQIEYDDRGQAQFIGVSFHDECGCDYGFNDRHIGDYSATELFELLATLDNSSPEFTTSEHLFRNLGVVVCGANSTYDYRGGHSRPVYAQVSVVNQAYFDAIAALEALS
jgi:hypothetical protein